MLRMKVCSKEAWRKTGEETYSWSESVLLLRAEQLSALGYY